MAYRTIEDRLREEYFALLPEVRRVVEQVEVEVRFSLLHLTTKLHKYERLDVKARVKDCESALGKLRRKQQFHIFDTEPQEPYTLKVLNDLAAVRVYAFPQSRWVDANEVLRSTATFSEWTPDPRMDGADLLAFKYHGYCDASAKIQGELQIVPMLIGLFEDVEHAAVYKPSPELMSIGGGPFMQKERGQVLEALKTYDAAFEKILRGDPLKE